MEASRHPIITIREAADDADSERLTWIIRVSFADVAERLGLHRCNCPAHPAFTTVDDQRQAIAKGIRYYVLEDEDGAAGCVAWDARVLEEPWLARLSVVPANRRRRYGQALLRHVVLQSRREGCRRVLIGAVATQEKLIAWYRRFGFSSRELRRPQHLPFEVLVMQLRLPCRGAF